MSLFFPGSSRCGICGEVMASGDDVVAFPAFLPRRHPLWRFSDRAFHRSCFVGHADGGAVQRLYERFLAIMDSRPKGLKSLEEINDWGRDAFKELEQDSTMESNETDPHAPRSSEDRSVGRKRGGES